MGFTGGDAADSARDRMLAAAKRAFLAQFLNRIDEVVVFEPLTEGQVREIGELLVARIADGRRVLAGDSDEHAAVLELCQGTAA